MKFTEQTAKHLREIHFGGNWTSTNLKGVLSDITWTEATTQVDNFNSIAALTYHSTYYVRALLNVLEGKPLNTKDELSFLCPSITSELEWKSMQNDAWERAEMAASLIEQLSEGHLKVDFTEEKYGSFYRNIHGIIEHSHYHLGQIVILKRLNRKTSSL